MGFQDLGFTPGDYALSAQTFSKVGGGVAKLGEFNPVGTQKFAPGNFYITLFKRDGSQRKVKEDKWLTEVYENREALMKDNIGKNGICRFWYNPDSKNWYLSTDNRGPNYKFPMNDYPISQTDGYQVYFGSGHTSAKLTYSGEVAQEDLDFNVTPGDYVLSGNVAPADMKLSEFIPVGTQKFAPGNFYITFFKRDGSQLKVKEDAWLTEVYENHEALMKDNIGKNGICRFWYNPDSQNWYLSTDNRGPNYKFPMNDYPIKAGQGFQVYAGSGHTSFKLVLPNAVK